MPEPDPVTYEIKSDTDDFKQGVEEAARALRVLQEEADAAKPPLTELQKAKKDLAAATKALTAQQKKETEAARAVTAQLKKEAQAERAVAKEVAAATKATKAAAAADNKRAGELKQGLNAVLGDQVNKVADVGAAFGTTGLAIVGSAAAGVVAVTALAAVTVVTLQGIVALASGVVDLTREMDGYSVEVNEANDAMDAAVAITDVLKGELATELAPEVERTAKLVGALGLAAADGFGALADGSDVAFEAVSRLTSLGIRPGTEIILTSLEAVNALARSMGAEVPEAIDAWIVEQRLANSGLTEFASGIENAEGALGDYLTQVDMIIASQVEETEASKAQAEAEEELAKAKKNRARDIARAQEKAAAEAAKAAAEAAKQQAQLFKQQIAAEDELRAIASERVQSQLSDLQKLEQARDDEINQINTLAFVAGGTVEVEKQAAEARLAVLEEFSQARFNLAIEDAAALQKIRDEVTEAEMAEAEKRLEIARAAAAEQKAISDKLRDLFISAANDVTLAIVEGASTQREAWIAGEQARVESSIAALEMKEQLTAKEAELLENLNSDKRRLAQLDFKRTQNVSTAQALVTGAQLALSASLPPPAGIGFPAGAIAAAAVTGAQIAIIQTAKPKSFHQGLDDQFQANLQRGEEVATAAAARRNPGVVGAMNSGAEIGGQGGQRWLVTLDGEEQARSTVQQLDEDGELSVRISDQSPGMSSGYGRRR